jgi:hypothetical protein
LATAHTPLVVGVFTQEEQAKCAVNALKDAGFGYDQVGVATHKRGVAADNLRNDFLKLGLSQERASFYEQAYEAGHIIVFVRPAGRDAEASTILHNQGAYNYPGNFATSQIRQPPPPDSPSH